jgi:signal transduction histidine kinase
VIRVSLRARATGVGILLSVVLLAGGALLLVGTVEHQLTQGSDQLSRSRVRDLLGLARAGELPAVISNVSDNGMAQVVDRRGRVLAASANILGRPAVADLAATRTPRQRTFVGPDDQETDIYRVWYAAGPGMGPGTHRHVTVYVGDGLESVDEASSALRRSLLVGVPFAVLAVGVVLWFVIGRTLARLDRIRAEVDRISEENLHARVAGDGVDDEVGRLAATMNAMLGRLDTAAQRQRDLVADVSHDLQSPLAAQRVALELALTHPEGIDRDALRAEVLGPMLGSTTQMERLVRDLLVLASLDAGADAQPRLIDLDELVLEEATRARLGSRVRIDTASVSAAPAHADPDDVRRIVRNLLDNAEAHAETLVVLRVSGDAGQARLDVVDDGPGVPPEQRDQVFDRFHRGDTARSRDGGSGLGLAIARGLAERGGGTLDLLDEPGGAHLRLVLPSAPGPMADSHARGEGAVGTR